MLNALPPADPPVMYDTLLPDPRTVEAVRRVICEHGAFIDERGYLWVKEQVGVFSRWSYRRLMHVNWVIVAKLMLSKQVTWDDRAYCYTKAAQ
jgi:hypothetical protein